MTQRARILIGLGILVALAALVVGVDVWQHSRPGAEPELALGSIPIRMNGRLVGGFTPEDLIVAPLAALGHTAKFLVKWGLAIVVGAPAGFVALGLTRSLIGYVVFGALGGLLGGLTLQALRRAGFFTYLAEKR